MTSRFRVLATPSFERDFLRTSKGNQVLMNALEELVAILAAEAAGIRSRNSLVSGLAKGNGESDGASTVCGTTFWT
jgi:hypothetical protein